MTSGVEVLRWECRIPNPPHEIINYRRDPLLLVRAWLGKPIEVKVPDLSSCEKISWVSPDYESKDQKWFLYEISRKEAVGKLVEIFQKGTITRDVDHYLIDGDKPSDAGWLIFYLKEATWTVRVYPHVSNKKTVNAGELIRDEDGKMVFHNGGFLPVIEVREDYREVIRKVVDGYDPKIRKVVTVETR